jgi:hypothetical protein
VSRLRWKPTKLLLGSGSEGRSETNRLAFHMRADVLLIRRDGVFGELVRASQ